MLLAVVSDPHPARDQTASSATTLNGGLFSTRRLLVSWFFGQLTTQLGVEQHDSQGTRN